jgi:hypothetical protein
MDSPDYSWITGNPEVIHLAQKRFPEKCGGFVALLCEFYKEVPNANKTNENRSVRTGQRELANRRL